MRLNEAEIQFIKNIALLFEENTSHIGREEFIARFPVSNNDYDVFLRKMEHLGVVENVSSVMGPNGYGDYFKLSPYSVELARDIDAQHESQISPDIVDQFKQRLHRNPKTAIIVIIGVVLAILIPLLNSGIELVQKLITLFSK